MKPNHIVDLVAWQRKQAALKKQKETNPAMKTINKASIILLLMTLGLYAGAIIHRLTH